MSTAPPLSVLMPCFNAARTLQEALDSLKAQSFTDFEIIAVDDGSTDDTAAILQAEAQEDARLRVFRLPHSGIVHALNAGLDACRASLVARMDADDISYPDRFGKQVQLLDSQPETGVAGCLVEGFPPAQVREGFRIYIDWLNSLVNPEDIRREIFVESPLAHPSVMFRRDLVLEAGGYQEHGWPEDYDLWLRLYLRGAAFHKVPETLFGWREWPERLTRTDSRYSLENFLRAKAHYLPPGPLKDRDGVFIWGAGMVGRRLSKHLVREGAQLTAFIDIDPKKIGRTRRGKPVISPEELPVWLGRYNIPVVLAAVGSRGARAIIRARLNALGLVEGQDWWGAA
jgi:glycosyltransferase involved in cell wall biosynthesis